MNWQPINAITNRLIPSVTQETPNPIFSVANKCLARINSAWVWESQLGSIWDRSGDFLAQISIIYALELYRPLRKNKSKTPMVDTAAIALDFAGATARAQIEMHILVSDPNLVKRKLGSTLDHPLWPWHWWNNCGESCFDGSHASFPIFGLGVSSYSNRFTTKTDSWSNKTTLLQKM